MLFLGENISISQTNLVYIFRLILMFVIFGIKLIFIAMSTCICSYGCIIQILSTCNL